MKKLLVLFLFASFFLPGKAQISRYLVQLNNKDGTPFSLSNPLAYLSQRAIERRTRYGITLDSTDLPPTPSYITQIRNVPNVTVLNVSKWLNSVSIQTTDAAAVAAISAFPFVESVTGVAARPADPLRVQGKLESEGSPPDQEGRPGQVLENYYNYGASAYNEIKLHNGEFLHNVGLRGQGMQIAMLDAGFFNYTTLRAFDSVNLDGRVLSTWDFVARETSVVEDNAHGMQCFSTIAANIPGEFVGKAPMASFHLFRTEDVASEYIIEEHNWVCGAERADSLGTDLISSSLGYTTFDLPGFDHDYADRNGDNAIITKGADLAAKKGILVFNAVGNIIDASTQFLSVPADGDSVIAVGSVNSSGVVASNSSFGPSPDGRVKPDMASVGLGAVVQGSSNNIGTASGTSFACPNMAGLTSCLWQAFPEYSNMQIADAVRQAGSIAQAPDTRIGYGIPDMKKAFGSLLAEFATVAVTLNGCQATVTWTSKDVEAMNYEVERKLPGEGDYVKVGDMVPQAGQLLAIRNYQYDNTIVSALPGEVSYRIRQIIDTSAAGFAAVYIDSAVINLQSGCFASGSGGPAPQEWKLWLQPNPVTGDRVLLVVQTPDAIPHMPIALYDGAGRLLVQWKESKGSGRKQVELYTGNLSPGKYYIRVFNSRQALGTVELIRL